MKKMLISLGLAGLLAVGVALPVMAQDPGDGGRPGHERVIKHARAALVRNAAETIGIEPRALAEELKGGKTIAQVATEHGVSTQLVIDNAVAAANARIDQAVANGKIKPETAAELKTRAAEKIADVVNNGFPKKAGG